jgi:hypothetical protein
MIIRKIAVGTDYKNAMNYVVGQPVLDGSHVIYQIVSDKGGSILIYIEKDKEILLWKKFTYSMPVSIEFNINFI